MKKRHVIYAAAAGLITVLVLLAVLRSYPAPVAAPLPENISSGELALPPPRYDSGTSVEQAILKRRSIRTYSEEPLTIADLSQLLWAAQGITSPEGFRTAPSAGALYPLEIYVVAGEIRDLAPGIYRYRPRSHALLLITAGDKRDALYAAALHQLPVREAPVDIVIAAVPERITGKYGERGIVYIYLEAGHAAENICLQSVPLNLGTVPIGAFEDTEVKKILGLGETELPVYIIPVGKI
jgi:SagB-type dehydrogenase family enzyme